MAELPNSPDENHREKRKHKRKLKKKLVNQSEDPEVPHVSEAQVTDSGLEPIKGKKKKKKRSETLPTARVEHEEPSPKRKKTKKKVGEGSEEEAVENGGAKEASASSSGRFTISMAVAGSIVDNAQSFALASRVRFFYCEWCQRNIRSYFFIVLQYSSLPCDACIESQVGV